MRSIWITLLLLGSVPCLPAQSVLPKHLLISLAGGGGMTTLHSNADTLNAMDLPSSAVRFSFGYALGTRWSLGGHYDRIGSVRHEGGVERVRFTTYMVEGTYRPHVGRHSALEAVLAGGYTIMALRPVGRLIPYGSTGAAFALGLRYLHLINETIGGFVAVDHAQALPQEVTFHDEPLQVMPDRRMTISWHSQRITAGMFVRF